MLDIKELKKSIRKRQDFFTSFKEEFYSFYTQTLNQYSFSDEIKRKIEAIREKVFSKIFETPKDTRDEFYSFSFALLKDDVYLRGILEPVFVFTVKKYSEYLLKEKPSLDEIEVLVKLLNEYLKVIDKAYLDYQKLNKKSENVSSEEERKKQEEKFILDILSENIGVDFTAISYYKEIPVIFKLKLKKVTDKYIILDISKVSINISKLNKTIYLKTKLFTEPVKAYITSVNFQKNIVVLEKPHFSDIPAEKRKHIRVVLDEPIKVSFRINGKKLLGLIVDISAGGIKFFTGDIDSISAGSKGEFSFNLSGKELNIKGEIKHIEKSGKGFMVGVQLFPDIKTENIISDFVMTKQFQILKELRI